MAKFEIKTLEISGFHSLIVALHLPMGGDPYLQPESEDATDVISSPNPNEGIYRVTLRTEVGIDPREMQLLQRLVLAGDEHAKVLRGINVGVLITAPVWFYRELETYRIGRERLSSESTMHIECKGLSGEELEAKKDDIPMGHIQRTVDTISYQTLRRIYFQRRNHRLPMWHKFCDWIKTLPFSKELITVEKSAVHKKKNKPKNKKL